MGCGGVQWCVEVVKGSMCVCVCVVVCMAELEEMDESGVESQMPRVTGRIPTSIKNVLISYGSHTGFVRASPKAVLLAPTLVRVVETAGAGGSTSTVAVETAGAGGGGAGGRAGGRGSTSMVFDDRHLHPSSGSIFKKVYKTFISEQKTQQKRSKKTKSFPCFLGNMMHSFTVAVIEIWPRQ